MSNLKPFRRVKDKKSGPHYVYDLGGSRQRQTQ
jgi:hypothetical protein